MLSFVCATQYETKGIKIFRSYLTDEYERYSPTICEVARATSAATTFFEDVIIGPYRSRYTEGGLVSNNPINQVWSEAQDIWCREEGNLQEKAKCIVSIGTGNPGVKPLSDTYLKLSSSSMDLVTQTEKTAGEFERIHRDLLISPQRYFRFNVERGLEDIGLAEYEKYSTLDSVTNLYMNSQEMKMVVRSCAQNLRMKTRTYLPNVHTGMHRNPRISTKI